jgi:hypothetical protein
MHGAGPSLEPRTWAQMAEIWADGLPTKTALNLFVTDPHQTYGWPVGVQPSGTIEAVWYVPDEACVSTIRITGPEHPNNVKAYATCWMEVSWGVPVGVALPDHPTSPGHGRAPQGLTSRSPLHRGRCPNVHMIHVLPAGSAVRREHVTGVSTPVENWTVRVGRVKRSRHQ